MAHNDVSISELFRLCQRIEQKVDVINGRVGTLERKVDVLEATVGTPSKKASAVSGGIGAGLALATEFLWRKFGG